MSLRALASSARAIGLAAALAACSHDASLKVTSTADLAPLAERGVVEIELVDGSTLRGAMIGGGGPSVLFQVSGQVLPRQILLRDIRHVSTRDRRRGVVEGAIMGGIGAAVLGVVVGAIGGTKAEPCGWGCTAGERALIYGAAGGLGGALIGGAIGLAAGSAIEHRLEHAPAGDQPPVTGAR